MMGMADRPVASYWDFRDQLAGDVLAKKVHPTAVRLLEHAAAHYGLGKAEAAEWLERFLADLERLSHRATATARADAAPAH
jgi:ABC-type phosphonate transport system ATPase subunit